MIVTTFSSAQVVIILASNDAVLIAQLRRDLLASKIKYYFALLSDRERRADATAAQISTIGGISPMVFVIDYKFVGTDCDVLLRVARSVPCAATIACVVINPPLECALRQNLIAGGARLFDGDSAQTSEHLTLQ